MHVGDLLAEVHPHGTDLRAHAGDLLAEVHPHGTDLRAHAGDLLAEIHPYGTDLRAHIGDLPAEVVTGSLVGLHYMPEEPLLQKLEQMLFLYFPPLFLLILQLTQHLHQRRSRVVAEAFL